MSVKPISWMAFRDLSETLPTRELKLWSESPLEATAEGSCKAGPIASYLLLLSQLQDNDMQVHPDKVGHVPMHSG